MSRNQRPPPLFETVDLQRSNAGIDEPEMRNAVSGVLRHLSHAIEAPSGVHYWTPGAIPRGRCRGCEGSGVRSCRSRGSPSSRSGTLAPGERFEAVQALSGDALARAADGRYRVCDSIGRVLCDVIAPAGGPDRRTLLATASVIWIANREPLVMNDALCRDGRFHDRRSVGFDMR